MERRIDVNTLSEAPQNCPHTGKIKKDQKGGVKTSSLWVGEEC